MLYLVRRKADAENVERRRSLTNPMENGQLSPISVAPPRSSRAKLFSTKAIVFYTAVGASGAPGR
jgi:hypothetical protein